MEHLSKEQCAGYRDRTLCVRDLLAVDAHLSGCPGCRELLRTYDVAGPLAPIVSRLGITHLTYEEMEAYVDQEGSTAIRSRVEYHSRSCSSCLRELNDLIAFRRQLTPAIVAIKRPEAVSQRNSSFPWKLSYLPAAAAAVLMLAGIGLWLRSLSPVARPGPILLALNDAGGQLRFTPTGTLIGGGWTDAERGIIEDAWRKKALEPPARISELRGRLGTQRSLDQVAQFNLVYPAGLAVLSTQPTLVWKSLEGASDYVVEIFDPNFHRVAQSRRLTITQWTPIQPLEAGKAYSWQVIASYRGKAVLAPGPGGPEARFEIVPAEEALELERVSSRYPNAHLLLGALYTRAGVLDSAEEQLSALAAANPQSAEAHRLLESLSKIRHQHE